jgi:hypothetical protein
LFKLNLLYTIFYTTNTNDLFLVVFLVAIGGKEINVALLQHELGLHDLVVLLSNQSTLALKVYAALL